MISAAPTPDYGLNNYFILMVKMNSDGTLGRYFDHYPTFDEAKTAADSRAGQGFACVVFDTENMQRVYEMNSFMVAAGMSSPVPTVADYLKLERALMEHEARRRVQYNGMTMDELTSLLNKVTENGDFVPRTSGQTPADRLNDYNNVPTPSSTRVQPNTAFPIRTEAKFNP